MSVINQVLKQHRNIASQLISLEHEVTVTSGWFLWKSLGNMFYITPITAYLLAVFLIRLLGESMFTQQFHSVYVCLQTFPFLMIAVTLGQSQL